MCTLLQRVKSLVLYYCLVVAILAQDCPFKECTCDQDDIFCGDLGLKEIPSMLGNATERHSLTLEGNSITEIPAGKLPSKLMEMLFARNPITVIDAHAFDGSQNTLETLSFSEAKFTKIPDAFLQLRVLKQLTIDDTSIQDWNDAAMKHIAPTLNTLELMNANLHTWPTWMQYSTNLTDLNLKGNFLSYIPDDGLDMFANTLTTLNLIQNNLTTFPKAIQKLTALQSLYLDKNKIVNTTWLPPTIPLTTLSLSNTHLVDAQDLSKSLRPYAQTLSSLSLDHNDLTQVPDVSYLTQIQTFDFTFNQISNTVAGSVPSNAFILSLDYNFLPTIPRLYANLTMISSIDLTFNLVRYIRGVDIPSWVTQIELSYNLITELTDTSFPENSYLESLDLVSNPLVKVSPNAFKNLQQLTSLNLQKTKLVRLPLALGLLTKLSWVYLDGTVGLVCTCQEKSLGDWVRSRTSSIDSKCGQVSVSYFFQYLSPSCP